MLRLFIISLIRNGVMKIIRVENWVSGYYFGNLNLIRIFVIVFYISIRCSGEILYLIYVFFFFVNRIEEYI